ncbi:MAG: recombinase RecT [Acidimicrobiales bacterium]
MSVRNAVAKRDQAVAEQSEAGNKPTLAQVAEQVIQRQAHMLDSILPAHVDRRRFAQMTIQAVRQAPDLARCFQTKQGAASFLLAVGQAAMVGLEPNTPTQDCWILPRKNDGVQEAQLTIGYRGLLRLARRSGTIKTIVAEVVREGDEFDYGYGADGPYLEWRPADEQGELTHAFAIAWFKDGGRAQMVLSRRQVEARRAVSDSWRNERARPYSPWTKWTEAMWRKSAIRALAPYLDLSVEAEATLHRDEKPLTFDAETGVIDVDEPFGELAAVEGGKESADDAIDAEATESDDNRQQASVEEEPDGES